MDLLHPVDAFALDAEVIPPSPPRYWYEGTCPRTQAPLRLPRTAAAEAIAQGLMQHLARDPRYQQEGKMYGVLLVATATGQKAVLKAFSGLLDGQPIHPGWVPPIPGREQVSLLERQTLQQLAAWQQAIMTLQTLPERDQFTTLTQTYTERLQALKEQHQARKQARDRRRVADTATLDGAALEQALADLRRQSQQDGIERRRLKRERDAVLTPLKAAIAQADYTIRQLKRQRKAASQQLQAQMHAAYALTNFAGDTTRLQHLSPAGLPTGTGDCAAPKLLHYAASQGLRPLALAEFWWGPASGDKQPGQFYGACVERCQPIMGFLLSGLSSPPAVARRLDAPLTILYEDEALLAIDKPAGLLSVPGRTQDLQDSVWSRLRCQRFSDTDLAAVHRLDKGTSGILLLAKTVEVHRRLNAQFAQRQVAKVYEAILSQPVAMPQGTIDLPLWRDPRDRPKTSVHFDHGKPSLTEFQVLAPGEQPRLQFRPHTGRTHQLRVHAAHPQGLNAPILGDTLYGAKDQTTRLYLHAQGLELTHPLTQKTLKLTSPVPF
jgi:tRNA pseudouridine32 synthase/23S rRNA pseudouridine746 synthase